jgi:hypothetical protein
MAATDCADCAKLRARVAELEGALQAAWVVERYTNGRLEYFQGRGADSWTYKNDDAMRFAREQDAQRACGWLCNDMGRAAEHMWIDGSIRSALSPPSGPQGEGK